MKIKKLSFAILMAINSNAMAEELILNPVEVTANPLIESIDVDPYSSSSAVVTEKQIKDLNAVDIASALRTSPGVQISRFNPVGGYGGDEGGLVAIRGMGTSRPGSEIKTYIDGIPFYMGVWNHPVLDLLPVNIMSGITVYKSPQPQVNGNNFASFDLTTKTASENGLHGDTRMSAGSFGTVTEQAALYGKQDAWDFTVAQGYAKSDGHRDNADGELKNLFGKVGYQMNEHWRTEASLLYVDNYARDPNPDNQYKRVPFSFNNGAFQGVPEYSSEAGLVSLALMHSYENLNGEIRFYANKGDGIWRNSPTYGPATMYNKFEMNGIKAKEEMSPWNGGHVRVGLDFDHITGHLKGANQYSNTPVDADLPDFYITSPYVAVSQDIKLNDDWKLVPSAGIRFYEHNVYESKTAPHAGISVVSEKATIYANVSRGINYVGLDGPALQVWGALFSNATSWKTLSPQELDHHEIGAKISPIQGTLIDVNVFNDEVKNRYLFNGNAGYAYMVGGYHTNGVELSIKQELGNNWIAFAGYTYLDPSNKTLPYMPRNSLSVGLNGKFYDFKVAIDAQSQSNTLGLNSSRFDATGSFNSPVAGFAVANVRVAYPLQQLGSKGEIYLAVENLFDKKYQYVPGYEMPGISGQVGFAANF